MKEKEMFRRFKRIKAEVRACLAQCEIEDLETRSLFIEKHLNRLAKLVGISR